MSCDRETDSLQEKLPGRVAWGLRLAAFLTGLLSLNLAGQGPLANSLRIRLRSALNGMEPYTAKTTSEGFPLERSTHLELSPTSIHLEQAQTMGRDGNFVPQGPISAIGGRQGFVLKTNGAPLEKAPPDAFIERQIRFPSQGLQMSGIVCLPATNSRRVPLIVMVQGSLPSDRDENIGANYLFRDLAHGLSAAGIATLRYDERRLTSAPSADAKQLTLDWQVTNDAVAALEYAMTIPEVDGSQIFVLGYSLGGTMAPYIAERFPKTRGIVLVEAAVLPIDQTIARQTRMTLKEQGKGESEIQQALSSQAQILADIRAGKTPATRMVNGAPASYWLDWMNRDPARELKKSNLPMLVLAGGRDAQLFEMDYEKLQKSLSGKASGMIEFHWFAELNHLFIRSQGKPSFDYSKPGHVDPSLIDTIAAWAKKRVTTKLSGGEKMTNHAPDKSP